MLKKKKIRKKYIALLTATVVVGTVFCAALISFIRSGGASELWESPMGYLVLVLFAVLPVLLLVLLAATATGNDDGEPAKTSGLPTLEAIRHAGLVDCIVVTTRYFGGTLLGTGGLVRAYTAAANAVLAAAKQVTVQVCVRGVLRVEYPL